MTTPVLFKVNTKKSKKEACRICNTKTRPCIDMVKNAELLETVNAALGLVVSPDSRLSKSVCVVCMSLVRLFEEFKRVCYDNQNDLWMMEQHLVRDRGSEVVDLLLRAKNTSIPGQNVSKPVSESDSNDMPEAKKPRIEVIDDDSTPETEPEPEIDEISFSEEMIEEHLEDTNVETEPSIRFMCQHINCDRLFDTLDEMKQHLATHQVLRPRSKPYTSNSRDRNESLTQDTYTCQVCMKVFEDIAGLVQHRKMNHFPKKCGFCNSAVPSETFTEHQKACRKENAKKLGIFVPRSQRLAQRKILPPDTALYKCGRCETKFKDVEEYKLHSKVCARLDS